MRKKENRINGISFIIKTGGMTIMVNTLLFLLCIAFK